MLATTSTGQPDADRTPQKDESMIRDAGRDVKVPQPTIAPERSQRSPAAAPRAALLEHDPADVALCSVCAIPDDPLDDWRSRPCLGRCGRTATPYSSCAPGYCRACAHSPSWVPLEELL